MANVFGASSGFGALTGWNLQKVSDPKSRKRAIATSKTNNETDSNVYDERQDITATYKAKTNYAAAAPTIPALIGALVNTYILTSIRLSLSASGFVTMVLAGHKHTASGASDGSDLRSIAHGISLSKGFGAGGLYEGAGALVPGGTFESIRSAELVIECDHEEDGGDSDGITTQGENHNPRISGSFSCFGTGPITAPSGYDEPNHTPDRDNAGYNEVSVQFYKALAFAE